MWYPWPDIVQTIYSEKTPSPTKHTQFVFQQGTKCYPEQLKTKPFQTICNTARSYLTFTIGPILKVEVDCHCSVWWVCMCVFVIFAIRFVWIKNDHILRHSMLRMRQATQKLKKRNRECNLFTPTRNYFISVISTATTLGWSSTFFLHRKNDIKALKFQ